EVGLARECVPDRRERELVRWVLDHDDRDAVLVADGNRVVHARNLLGQEAAGLAIDLPLGKGDEWKPLLAREEPREVFLLDQAALEQHLAQPPARALPFLQRVFEIFGSD